MDQGMRRNCVDIGDLLKGVLSTDPSTYTTPDWEEQVTESPSPKSKLPNGDHVPERSMMPQIGNENKKTEIPSAEKIKLKTTGKAQERTTGRPSAASRDW
jgi:hypothetical protein